MSQHISTGARTSALWTMRLCHLAIMRKMKYGAQASLCHNHVRHMITDRRFRLDSLKIFRRTCPFPQNEATGR